MNFDGRNLGFLVIFMFLGGILFSALGTLLENMVPAMKIVNTNLTGFIGFNLELIRFEIKLSIASIIGIIIGIVIFKKI